MPEHDFLSPLLLLNARFESKVTMRLFLVLLFLLFCSRAVAAESPGLPTQIVLATYRLEHPKTSGTAFVLRRANADQQKADDLLLVTAAHAFEQMDGDQAKLVLRKQDSNGDWSAAPIDIAIRREGKPLWQKHPEQDVAVLRLELKDSPPVNSLDMNLLATADDWQVSTPEPGTELRCVGFPHAAQFKPSEAGFPLTRLGAIASYPLVPFKKQPTFLVDYNTFEGDSGGPVYLEMVRDGKPQLKIVGLVHGQHFIEERFKLVYQEGVAKLRLGLAIVVNSRAILETIQAVP
jgi:hypothetical protein